MLKKNSEPDDSPQNLGGTNYDRARSAIRQDIISGYFPDGKHLTTTELAQRYRLSLAPIREALHLLAAEGIIRLQPNRGAIVRSVTPDFLAEIYEVKLGLIPYMEGVRAELATDEDVEAMVAIEEKFERAVANGDTELAIELNREFHQVPMRIKPNMEAYSIIARYNGLIEALRGRFGFGTGRQKQTIEEHRAIVDAYRRRNADDARAVSRFHLINAYEDLERFVSTPEAPKEPA